ncbi:LppP/LprE family lipoprotein [Curtobacterium oceanosedimentum]|uniref:LppP/LprE family lipoprotein n=1 Tax=Curtobacterium oceanosedimentum TaxID=465820 RepID=UPI001CE123A3|nr:LppP/LprE family lipoprotein [Curtobacterium oceanosedimentum]MCA5922702.1 LppP/LprE family lipoprotein [Curtobacterium oceanosedimentum]
MAALLTGCSGADGADGGGATSTPTVTETVTAPPSDPAAMPSPTPTPTPTCGPASGAEAAAAGIAALPSPAGIEGARWDAANADTSGYDACAALSWSVVAPERATAGSPYAILLFHQGRYLGTATAEQYAFEPTIERRTDGSIVVTYRYPLAGEPNAEVSGRATATFTWNAETSRVDMTGETPPAR